MRATAVGYRAQMNRLGAVMVLIVALAPAASVAAAPAAPAAEWTIDLPTGWRDDDALTKQTLDELNRGLAKQGTERPRQVAVRVWVSSDQLSTLIATWYVLDLAHQIERQIDAFDGGAIKKLVGTAQPQRIEGSQIIRDIRVDQPIRARMVRRYQPAKDGLHILAVFCLPAPETDECGGALDRTKLTVVDPVPLDYGDPGHDLAYYAIGSGLVLVGLLAGGVRLGRIVLRRFG